MIRAHRVSATAQDDASLISGWNIAPNVSYSVTLLPGAVSCGVLLYDDGTLAASGAALTGSDQPCILSPQSGQAIAMIDAELGWHLLLTTIGTESARTIRVGPAIDLPDEIHPVYGDNDLSLARATAAIDEAAHYIDDVAVTCPLGVGAGVGDVVSVPVEGVAVVGQVESITWAATPDGPSEQAVVRRYVAIAPAPHVDPVLPAVDDDTGATDSATTTSGNVLTNDEPGLTVVAVNGLLGNVAGVVAGDNGGKFTVAGDGSWTFDPDSDFDMLTLFETADTSVTYHASNGVAEAMATLTITVSRANTAPVVADDTGETTADTTTSGNVLINDTDANGDSLTVSQVSGASGNVGVAVVGSNGGLFNIAADGGWTFDPNGDFAYLANEETTTTNVIYHASDGVAEDDGTVTVTVTGTPAVLMELVGTVTGQAGRYGATIDLPAGLQADDLVLVMCGAADGSSGLTISGYTQKFFQAYAGIGRTSRFAILYKFMGETPDTTISLPGSGDSIFGAAGVVMVFRGVNTSVPFDVNPVYTGFTANNAIIAPGITVDTAGSIVVSAIGLGITNCVSPTGISGYAGPIAVCNDPSSAMNVCVCWQGMDAGQTGDLSWQYTIGNVGSSCIATTFALQPV